MAAYQRNDYAKSLKLLRPLAEKGDARAQYLVGRQYQFGQAVKANRAEAFYWYKRAEAKGHNEAKLFRLLLEKRWKISVDEKGRAEKRIAAENAPKPPPRVARIESRPKPRPEKPVAQAAGPREKPKPAPSVAERAKPAPAKRAVETARAKIPEPAKAKAEAAKAKTPDKPAIVAARTAVPEETSSRPPSVQRGQREMARATPRLPVRSDDEDDDDGPAPPRRDAPPPETRTTIAAVPNTTPPSDEYSPDYSPYYRQSTPGYAPPATGYAPPAPHYAPGPAPYYAPAAPPTWRATIYYGPRAYYPRHWGYRAYRPYSAYAHPGWRGRSWRGRR